MSGVVGIIATDLARYTLFTSALLNLRGPVNTEIRWSVGTDLANGRNRLVEQALDGGAEWVFFLDDDASFDGEILMRLLAHEQPLVASLYLSRAAPYHPVAYGRKSVDAAGDDVWHPISMVGAPATGLVPIVAAGSSGMLVRSEVFRAVGWPWFEKTNRGSEDITFCERATAAGFDLHVDLGAAMGHLGTLAIWPVFSEEAGGWATQMTLSDKSMFLVGTPGGDGQ